MKKILLSATAFVASCLMACGQKMYKDADVEGFARMVGQDTVQVVDVRTPEEFKAGHIARAVNINVFDNDFMQQVKEKVDKRRPVAVYCRSGKRSAKAAQEMGAMGYKVTNLKGGILKWKEEGKETVNQGSYK